MEPGHSDSPDRKTDSSGNQRSRALGMRRTLKLFRGSLSLLATRRFGTFWFASLLSSIGTWSQQVAEPWLLLSLGASSFVIGLDSFAMSAPIWFLTLFGGRLADRSDRRRVITFFQSIQMLCPAAIVVLLIVGGIQAWMIIALSLIVGITDALSLPSFQSIVPSIVERDQIGSGLALNSIQFNLSRILGPSIAGVLIASFGVMACFVVSVVSYIPFIGIALWILPRKTPKRCDPIAASHEPGGIRVILGDRQLRGALLTVLSTSTFCAPLVTFAPVLVKNVFHGSASEFSIAVASFGSGGLIGALALLGIPHSVDQRRLSAGFAFVLGGALILTGLVPGYWGLPPLLLIAGASTAITATTANTFLQGMSDPKKLGQTVGLYTLMLRGGMSIGALLTGAAVSLLGVQHALLIDGVLAVSCQLVLTRSWLRPTVPASR